MYVYVYLHGYITVIQITKKNQIHKVTNEGRKTEIFLCAYTNICIDMNTCTYVYLLNENTNNTKLKINRIRQTQMKKNLLDTTKPRMQFCFVSFYVLFIYAACLCMCFFSLLLFLFASLCTRMTFKKLWEGLRSGSFTITLILRRTRMHSLLSSSERVSGKGITLITETIT